jgi:acylphosphatase
VEGRVTGVGFRYSALNKAYSYPGLKGYIKNVGYGKVEAVLQGSPEAIEDMSVWLRRGPALARVDRFSINKIPLDENLEKFHIR